MQAQYGIHASDNYECFGDTVKLSRVRTCVDSSAYDIVFAHVIEPMDPRMHRISAGIIF